MKLIFKILFVGAMMLSSISLHASYQYQTDVDGAARQSQAMSDYNNLSENQKAAVNNTMVNIPGRGEVSLGDAQKEGLLGDGKYGVATEAFENAIKASSNISSTDFEIDVFGLTGTQKKNNGTTTENVNFLLATIIQKLMVALGSIALLIMTIGGGYMVLYHGQDELLSKGKSIFNAGVISLVVALGSYYIVEFISFILYR